MRRVLFLIVSMFVVALILPDGDAAAIPTFGTFMPKSGEWQAGGRTNLIFERSVKDYDKAKTNAYWYKVSFGFADWFCFDGVIGSGDVRAAYINEKVVRYPFSFSGGYGWRAKLYRDEEDDMVWLFGFQHVSTHPKSQQYDGRKREIIWDEWQFSTLLSKRLWALRPYCGTKWSFTYLISKVDGDRHRRLSNSPPLGLVVGADLQMNNYLYMNAEARFFDETALNAGFTIRY